MSNLLYKRLVPVENYLGCETMQMMAADVIEMVKSTRRGGVQGVGWRQVSREAGVATIRFTSEVIVSSCGRSLRVPLGTEAMIAVDEKHSGVKYAFRVDVGKANAQLVAAERGGYVLLFE